MKHVIIGLLALLLSGTAVAHSKHTCWDGSVVKNEKFCPPIKLLLVCPDGKIVENAVQCPPIKICLDGTVTATGGTCPPPPTPDPVVSE